MTHSDTRDPATEQRPANENADADSTAETAEPVNSSADAERTVEASDVPESDEAEEDIIRTDLAFDDGLAALREDNAKLKDQLLRALAEAENSRRRAQREKEDTARFAISKFATDLVEVEENLLRALEAVPKDQLEHDEAVKQLFVGVEMIQSQLIEALRKHGLVRISPEGEKFDPNYHQAMFEVPNSGALPGTVVQVMQAGYVLNGRLLRPAMVGVAKGEPPPSVDTSA